jgi:hypothetical protein
VPALPTKRFTSEAVGGEAEAQFNERVHEPVGVLGEEGVRYPGWSIREGGDEESAVGDALGAGDADAHVGRALERCDLHFLGKSSPHVL